MQLEKQVSLLDSTSSETIRQRLVLLKNEWDDFKRERSKQVRSRPQEDRPAHIPKSRSLICC